VQNSQHSWGGGLEPRAARRACGPGQSRQMNRKPPGERVASEARKGKCKLGHLCRRGGGASPRPDPVPAGRSRLASGWPWCTSRCETLGTRLQPACRNETRGQTTPAPNNKPGRKNSVLRHNGLLCHGHSATIESIRHREGPSIRAGVRAHCRQSTCQHPTAVTPVIQKQGGA
jgi:hypothetical protein